MRKKEKKKKQFGSCHVHATQEAWREEGVSFCRNIFFSFSVKKNGILPSAWANSRTAGGSFEEALACWATYQALATVFCSKVLAQTQYTACDLPSSHGICLRFSNLIFLWLEPSATEITNLPVAREITKVGTALLQRDSSSLLCCALFSSELQLGRKLTAERILSEISHL